MATTFTSPGLTKATTEALVAAQPELNVARLFANDMSDEFADINATVKVPLIGDATVNDFDISSNDYENASGSVTYADIKLNKQPKATFEFKGADVLEAPNAPYWNKVALSGANAVKKSISQYLGGLFTTAACTGGSVTVSSVTKANIAKLRGECVGRISETVLGLDPTYFAELLSLLDSNVYGGDEAIKQGYIPGLYGFKAVVPMYDLPAATTGDNATPAVKGVLVHENAVAFASRAVAVADPAAYTEFGSAADDFGFTITTLRHGAPGKGKAFLNMTALYGAKIINGAAVKYIHA